MPTRGYLCVKCGHEFERMEAMSEKPLTQCSQIIT
ncbi:MAG: FmdB family zinc ribbon protein, partial [Planctomycetota bacterium]